MPDVISLSDREDDRARRLKAIEAYAVKGMNKKESAAYAGITPATLNKMLDDRRVQQYIQQMQQAQAEALNIRREDVLRGILDAIKHAKLLSDPNAELRGWEAIAKMQGYNAPERHLHDLPEDTKRLMEAMQGMSETDIAKMANMDNLLELTPGVDFEDVTSEKVADG